MRPLNKLAGKLLGAALTVLEKAAGQRADAALREVLRRDDLLPEDKRFVTESVFAYYRWYGWLDHGRAPSANLRFASQLAEQFGQKPGSFTDEEMVRRAVPDWAHGFVKITPAMARAFQRPPRLWLRARGGHARELADLLGDCEVHAKVPGALWYRGSDDLFSTFEFKRGEFEIQDLSSQLVGLACAPAPGSVWWDACAGEGGKLLHLGGLMQGKGLVWASDPAEWRLEKLKKRAARAQVFNYRAKAWSNKDQLPTRTKFDGILVDAPCSGIGTWGRNPHARWTTTPKDVGELAAVQKELLGKVAAALKPGGRLIYSVCTLAAPETTGVADHFDATQPGFEPAVLANPVNPGSRASRIEWLPQELFANGMFIAGWRKPGA